MLRSSAHLETVCELEPKSESYYQISFNRMNLISMSHQFAVQCFSKVLQDFHSYAAPIDAVTVC